MSSLTISLVLSHGDQGNGLPVQILHSSPVNELSDKDLSATGHFFVIPRGIGLWLRKP